MDFEEAKDEVYGALWEKDLNKLKVLISEHPKLLNERYHGDKNILHLAASSGSDILVYLLDNQIDVDVNTLWGEEKGLFVTPLLEAAKEGDLDNVRLLVSRGANINVNLGVYSTPLYGAASKGHLDVVKFLVEKGADPLSEFPSKNWKGGFLNSIRNAYQYPEIQEYLISITGYEEPEQKEDKPTIKICRTSKKLFKDKVTLLDEFDLKEYKKYLEKACRYSFDLISNKTPCQTGGSKLGGSPDLPLGTEWPSHDDGPYRFLAQINFSEFKSPDKLLPKSGLLVLFVADDPEQSFFWQDPDYIKAIYIKSPKDLMQMEAPESMANTNELSIDFSLTVDIPFDEEQAKGWDEEKDSYEVCSDFRDALHESSHQLLGYPSHCTLAYDPTPVPEYISLFTFSSCDDLEWCWHDGGNLMIFIEKEKLKKCDFSELKSDAG